MPFLPTNQQRQSTEGNKAYYSDISVKIIYQSFTHNTAAKASWR